MVPLKAIPFYFKLIPLAFESSALVIKTKHLLYPSSFEFLLGTLIFSRVPKTGKLFGYHKLTHSGIGECQNRRREYESETGIAVLGPFYLVRIFFNLAGNTSPSLSSIL